MFSFIYLFIHLFIHSFIHSFIHLFIHSVFFVRRHAEPVSFERTFNVCISVHEHGTQKDIVN